MMPLRRCVLRTSAMYYRVFTSRFVCQAPRHPCLTPTLRSFCSQPTDEALSEVFGAVVEDSEEYQTLKVLRKGGITSILFNRPHHANVLDMKMVEELTTALHSARLDPTTRLTVTAATGRVYCGGHKPGLDAASGLQLRDGLHSLVKCVLEFPKPLAALVMGPCVGVLAGLLPLYDVVLAAKGACFQTTVVESGETPCGCCTYTYPRLMGHARAAHMLLLGHELECGEAQRSGLVTEVLPTTAFHHTALSTLHPLTATPPPALSHTKQLMRQPLLNPLTSVSFMEASQCAERVFPTKTTFGAFPLRSKGSDSDDDDRAGSV